MKKSFAIELAVGRGFSGIGGVVSNVDIFAVGDPINPELARRTGVWLGPTPFDERKEFIEAFRRRVGVLEPGSRAWEGLREGGLGLGEWELRRAVLLKGVVGSERCDGPCLGDVVIANCLSDRARSLLSSSFKEFVDGCRRSGAFDGEAIAQCTL